MIRKALGILILMSVFVVFAVAFVLTHGWLELVLVLAATVIIMGLFWLAFKLIYE